MHVHKYSRHSERKKDKATQHNTNPETAFFQKKELHLRDMYMYVRISDDHNSQAYKQSLCITSIHVYTCVCVIQCMFDVLCGIHRI